MTDATGRSAGKRDEREVQALFDERYLRRDSSAARLVERTVIGADWGANGYTTVAQADELAGRLHLGPGMRLLDLGAGLGWPGLYLSAETGCSVTLVDLPHVGLAKAMRRADQEGLGSRVLAVVAGGLHPPLRPGSFDGVVHTDVIC